MCDKIFNASAYVNERPVFCSTTSVDRYAGKACVAREQTVEYGAKQHSGVRRIWKTETDNQNPRKKTIPECNRKNYDTIE